ncbi:TetR/AcrR family transcriptional regulator [Sulfurimonas crateris]|uniref:TetR/AcrR family transcriptional regulator n=1 Tax=Sulfurimonas crateris TaxID=2574727 RepID=A0A4U2ZA28_9BACT|nr:TetR/AcrR family transcriptional regulator [Sulfurimonas crateris]TKI69871.1 TetR/AcrR family transcriptional regulator [Sulfurimonas crateris]
MPENRTIPKKSNTKQKILKASSALFSEHGFKATSVRKIASEVGIRESALYNHFKNKEEIFLCVAKEIFTTPFSDDKTDIKESALRGKAFLQKFAMQYKLLTFDKNNENMFRLLMIELFQNRELREQFMNEFHNENIKMLSEAFFIMMQHSLVRSADPIMVAYEFVSTLFYIRLQITLLRFDNTPTTALSTQFEKHVEFFWESIRV